MKRILLVLLAIVMALSICACSAEEEPTAKPSTGSSALATQMQAQVGSKGELIYEGSSNKCLFENENCSVTLMKAEIDSLSDYCWDVTLVNRSESTQIFTIKRAYVNDFDFDPLWVERVEAGQTVESSVIWESPDLQARGILQVTRVDFSLSVYDADSPEQSFADASITVYPSAKSAHITQSRSRVTTDIDVVDNEDFKFVIVGYDDDMRWGKALEIYAHNKTNERVIFTMENVTVEDQAASPSWSYSLDAGKQGLSQIVWFDSVLGEITTEGSLEFEYELVIRTESGHVLARVPHTFVP